MMQLLEGGGEHPGGGGNHELYKAELLRARSDVLALLGKLQCHPILIRLAWHDAGTFDASVPLSHWPKCGGANGSIRFEEELEHGAK